MNTPLESWAHEVIVGVDPFDALRSPRIPDFVASVPRGRQAVVQIRKRLPIELSGLLGIRPFAMAKTAGCMLQAESRRAAAGVEGSLERSEALRSLLERDTTLARSNGGWGYEFDVQTRWAFYAAGSPNVIATYFVARGLLEHWLVSGSEWSQSQAVSAARYIASDLIADRGHVCYTPTNSRLIHNANALGAGLLASVGRLIDDPGLVEAGARAAASTAKALDVDGLWPYGESGTSLGWSDNFHTAYTLDGLLSVWLATGDEAVRRAIDRGLAAWLDGFFGPAGEPYYFDCRRGPFDIHSAATAIDVSLRLAQCGFGVPEHAHSVLEWTRRNLVDGDGCTFYRKNRWFVDKRHFTRWGQAHWEMALASETLQADAHQPLLEGWLQHA